MATYEKIDNGSIRVTEGTAVSINSLVRLRDICQAQIVSMQKKVDGLNAQIKAAADLGVEEAITAISVKP